MGILASVLYLALYFFQLALIVRIGMEMIRAYSPRFRPSGVVLIAFEAVYTVTDPPVKALRSLIPPLRLGAVALDLSVIVLFFVTSLLMSIFAPFVL